MAHLRNHAIVSAYQSKAMPHIKYLVTKNDRLLMLSKRRYASVKLAFLNPATQTINFSGNGTMARASDKPSQEYLARFATPLIPPTY